MITDKTLLKTKFDQAVPYRDFVAMGEPMGHRPPWDERYSQLELTDEQAQLVKSFVRRMHVLCLTGTWCGDCALQGSAMQRIAAANPDVIDLRFIMREESHADLIVKTPINQGFRVPVTWFLAEDFEPVGWMGDRTLSRYRSMARKGLPDGGSIVLADPPADPVRQVLNEVMDEFERTQLLLRISPRMREIHGD